VDHLKGSPRGEAPSLTTKIRLGWKGLPGANDLDYYENYDRKKFYWIGPSGQYYELFMAVITPLAAYFSTPIAT
jgi:hypothetical protein